MVKVRRLSSSCWLWWLWSAALLPSRKLNWERGSCRGSPLNSCSVRGKMNSALVFASCTSYPPIHPPAYWASKNINVMRSIILSGLWMGVTAAFLWSPGDEKEA
ncbi:hypothetical protein FHG87_020732 [Trinorchestia longiramus]|nr:hypothetical protein FHG87_020732 [Trinorchestia longiramus]